MKRVILASGSPRRKTLLEWAEIAFEVMVSDVPEDFPPGISASDAAVYIAAKKAFAVRKMAGVSESDIIVAADTVVVLEDQIIGKPAGKDEAVAILKKLSGKTHLVITGVCIHHKNREISFADTTEVEFHELTDVQIGYYVDKFRPFDKAGAYAIQEWIGVTGICRINGDFYNVMGLPVSRVVQLLQQFSE